jgi:hypothetical protein
VGAILCVQGACLAFILKGENNVQFEQEAFDEGRSLICLNGRRDGSQMPGARRGRTKECIPLEL